MLGILTLVAAAAMRGFAAGRRWCTHRALNGRKATRGAG
jgi:hypothetical protein